VTTAHQMALFAALTLPPRRVVRPAKKCRIASGWSKRSLPLISGPSHRPAVSAARNPVRDHQRDYRAV